MSLAVVDAREWQNMFDLRTGDRVDGRGELVDLMKRVLKDNPYPGDMDGNSNGWVSDVALDLIEAYQPRFVMLNYAGHYFRNRYTAMEHGERQRLIDGLFREIERFTAGSGFVPLIIGRGGMTPFLDYIDLSRLDGLAIATHWSVKYAGLHQPSAADLRLLEDHPQIRMVAGRPEFLRLFAGATADCAEQARVPEYLLVAERGYAFKTVSSTMRRPVMIPDVTPHVPLNTPLGGARHITAIRKLVEDNLAGNPVALIVLEGVGINEFPLPMAPCGNGREWYCYEPGASQFLAITSGRDRVFDYPSGYKSYTEDSGTKEYPLSGYFTSIPEDTIGAGLAERSVAVGNNSMFAHMVSGADLCVECFARNLANQGSLGVIHRQDKI